MRKQAVFLLTAAFLAGCATMPVIRVDQGGPQARLVGLEQQLHDDDRLFSEKLAREGALYNDPALTPYLADLGRKLTPPNLPAGSPGYQFWTVRDPTVNAFSLSNARTYYHLGLIAQARNPDMLAAVMAHEISHSLHRDMVYMREDIRQKTVAAKIAQIPVIVGGALVGDGGLAATLLNVSYAASVTGYGREKEAQADRYAMERLKENGMNPAGTIQMFETFLKEEGRYQRGLEIWFLMSHPATRQRLAEAKKWLEEQHPDAAPPQDDPEFLKLTDPARLEAAALNVRYERYFHALDILEDVSIRRPEDPAVLCLQAECYRRLAENRKIAESELSSKAWAKTRKDPDAWKTDWQQKAQETFSRALAKNPSYPDAEKGLGLLCAGRGENAAAIQHWEAYLSLKPDARDRRSILSRLEKLKRSFSALTS